MELRDVTLGMRVAIHPATSLWMRGVRFADVVKIGRKTVTVEAAGLKVRVHPSNLEPVV
jgi:hypothetical protein